MNDGYCDNNSLDRYKVPQQEIDKINEVEKEEHNSVDDAKVNDKEHDSQIMLPDRVVKQRHTYTNYSANRIARHKPKDYQKIGFRSYQRTGIKQSNNP